MKEKIAEKIPIDCDGCNTPTCGQETDPIDSPCSLQLLIADKVLTLINEEIKKVENPYMCDGVKLAKVSALKALEIEIEHQAFEECRQAILEILK